MGDKVSMGRITYTVFETKWETQLPVENSPRVPQHRFFLVRISAVNGGSDTMILPNLSIEDDKGKVYDELNNGDGVPMWAGYIRQVAPAHSIEGNIVFDAPPAHYKLRVTDESVEKLAYVDIPLNFGSENEVVTVPEKR